MTTDFFEKQDQSRSATTRLVCYLILGVIAVVVSSYLIVLAVFHIFGIYSTRTTPLRKISTQQAIDKLLEEGGRSVEEAREQLHRELTDPLPLHRILWRPYLFFPVLIMTLLIVGAGSWSKIVALSDGGKVVAKRLGGRNIRYLSTGYTGKRLLNVVQEMAIAAGISPPPVYLLDEDGINAFAAGFTTDDAVIGVTRGAAKRLTRSELQGMIAHEFSHILNGDMKLNIRITGIVHGLLILGIVGYRMFSRRTGRGTSRPGKGVAGVTLVGLGLMVVGYVGTFFGNLIKAAVNRQREYLADASAVQFTRNPKGIAGALKTIGGFSKSARISHENAEEVSHMFFDRAVSGWRELFSTHPPISSRIQRIQPEWDGKYIERSPLSEDEMKREIECDGSAVLEFSDSSDRANEEKRISETEAPSQPEERLFSLGVNQLEQIGQLQKKHLHSAQKLLRKLPESLQYAAYHPKQSQAMIVALLIHHNKQSQEQSLALLRKWDAFNLTKDVLNYLNELDQISIEMRYPLLTLAISQLQSLSNKRKEAFCRILKKLIESDRKVELFEWCLYRFLRNAIDIPENKQTRNGIRFESLHPVREHCRLLLSVFSHVGHEEKHRKKKAFNAGMEVLDIDFDDASLIPVKKWDLSQLDASLEKLQLLSWMNKRKVLRGGGRSIQSDGKVTVKEGELFRAISGILGCPMPPIFTD